MMNARRSTQVRRRSAFRADKSRARRSLGGGRSILDVAFFPPTSGETCQDKGKGKGKQVQVEAPAASEATTTAADTRCLRAVHRHIFTHSLDIVLPLPSQASDSDAHAGQGQALAALGERDPHLSAMMKAINSGGNTTFYLAKVPLALFLSPEFVTGFIRNGSLIALSISDPSTAATSPQEEASIALDGQGLLHLSLPRELYQTLGLVGRESRFHRGPSGRMGDRTSGDALRYVVELPLCASSFVPGRRGYERALACLKAWDWDRAAKSKVGTVGSGGSGGLVPTDIGAGLSAGPDGAAAAASTSAGANATWQMLFAWTPPDFGNPPAATSAPTHGDIAFPKALVHPADVRRLSASSVTHISPDTWIPSLRHPLASHSGGSTSHDDDMDVSTVHNAEPTLLHVFDRMSPLRAKDGGVGKSGDAMEEVHEAVQALTDWAGLACLHSERIRTFSRADPLVDTTHVPTPRWAGAVLHLSWRGLLTPAFCKHVLASVQTYLDSSSAPAPAPRHQYTNGTPDSAVNRSFDAPTDPAWATILATGFEHAPLSWSSRAPGLGTALGSGLALPGSDSSSSRPRKRLFRRGRRSDAAGEAPAGEENGPGGSDDVEMIIQDNEAEDGPGAVQHEQGGEDEEDDWAPSADDSGSDTDDDDEDEHEDDDEDENEAGTTSRKKRQRSGRASTTVDKPSTLLSRTPSAKNAKQRDRLKRKRKSHVRRGEAEHGRGRSGWSAILLGRAFAPEGREGVQAAVPRYVLVEDLGLDTRQ